jgi:hypothetical protein
MHVIFVSTIISIRLTKLIHPALSVLKPIHYALNQGWEIYREVQRRYRKDVRTQKMHGGLSVTPLMSVMLNRALLEALRSCRELWWLLP